MLELGTPRSGTVGVHVALLSGDAALCAAAKRQRFPIPGLPAASASYCCSQRERPSRQAISLQTCGTLSHLHDFAARATVEPSVVDLQPIEVSGQIRPLHVSGLMGSISKEKPCIATGPKG